MIALELIVYGVCDIMLYVGTELVNCLPAFCTSKEVIHLAEITLLIT